MPLRHFRFPSSTGTPAQEVISHVAAPEPAVAIEDTNGDFALHTTFSAEPFDLPHGPSFRVARARGAEVAWSPNEAFLRCDPEHGDAMTLEVLRFTHYARELHAIEREVAASWGDLEQDKAVAFEATPAALKRSAQIGQRMGLAFGWRIRLARLEPHLYAVDDDSDPMARKLGEDLREKTSVEGRLEVLDGQIEVFEHVYEMASQRLGEFRASHSEHRLEWVIIFLLAVEVVALLLFHGH